MFSEYASRFLAQSQSRVGFRSDESSRNGNDRSSRPQGTSRLPIARSYMQRTLGDPYQQAASQISHYPFHSKVSARPAPLFFSATDEFREEDEETEREREIADFYALQRSRRHFGSSHLQGSSDGERSSIQSDGQVSIENGLLNKGQGIKSSWRGEHSGFKTEGCERDTAVAEDASSQQGNNKVAAKLIDVGLEDTIRSQLDNIQDDYRLNHGDVDPPVVQRLRAGSDSHKSNFAEERLLPAETNNMKTSLGSPRMQPSSSSSTFPISDVSIESHSHDVFWGHLFLICLAGLFATSFLVYLHTSTPSGDKSKWGDTIYVTIHKSFFLLGVYTLVSVFISLLWLALVQSYVRPLVYLIIIALPTILCSFSLYPFISSFSGSWDGKTLQDKVMRFASALPFLIACAWIYTVIRCRHAISKAVNILEFSCRILAANPELLVFGLTTLVSVVSWTWMWMLLFTRVFLGGHLASTRSFVIDLTSWWLGVYFVIVYLWSIGVIAGIQRAVTGATVSQWYFHRFAAPAPTSSQIVRAAVVHSLTSLFGTICLSRLLILLIRLPYLLLPIRLTSLLSLFAYSLVPAPISALTNPLTLTYASIHSQPLGVSARALGQTAILGRNATNAFRQPRGITLSSGQVPLQSYKLSKLMLHAARFMMSFALGFGGWVTTARSLNTPGASGTIHGSLYGYIVGLLAGTLGWNILGSIEGVVADIVDASVICWSSEIVTYGGEARYCREAGFLFGEGAPVPA